MAAVEAKNLSKMYKIYPRRRDWLKELIFDGRRKYHQEFWALKDINFVVEKGTTVGVIGQNGSGKSTLLQLIAGILQPTQGSIWVNGRVSALLELGAGFNPEFTGRENAFMNGAIMGISRKEMERRFDQIAQFAEIGDFIDRPVKTYSSGMYVRLAFAVAINVDPDVLLVDEALAVGDVVFQHRCIRKIRQFKEAGKTIIFVSHDMNAIKSLCDRALLLDNGRLLLEDGPDMVVNKYLALTATREANEEYVKGDLIESKEGRDYERKIMPASEASSEDLAPMRFVLDPNFDEKTRLFRYGTGEARIRNVELFDKKRGTPLSALTTDDEAIIRVHIEYLADVPSSIVGIIVRDKNGLDVYNTNTKEENVPLGFFKFGDRVVVDFIQQLPLRAGSYSITVAIARDELIPIFLDWVDNALVFEKLIPKSGKYIHGIVDLRPKVRIHKDKYA